MKAKEAREKAIAYAMPNEYNRLMGLIEQSVSRGELFVWIEGFISGSVVEKLTDEGFKIGKPQTSGNETIIKISW